MKKTFLEILSTAIMKANCVSDDGAVRALNEVRERVQSMPDKDAQELTDALKEIHRLSQGGCARDQRTTQFCAEAATLAMTVDRLEKQRHKLSVSLHRLRGAVDTVEAAGRPHGSNPTYPDGCECAQCQAFDTLIRERGNEEAEPAHSPEYVALLAQNLAEAKERTSRVVALADELRKERDKIAGDWAKAEIATDELRAEIAAALAELDHLRVENGQLRARLATAKAERQALCEHVELDHGICLECGADCTDRLIDRAESMRDAAKENA